MIDLFVTLKPRGPLHVGQDGDLAVVADRVPADTLWSALYVVALEPGGEPLRRGLEEGEVLFSSTVPVWKGIRFLPRPFLPRRARAGGEAGPAPGQSRKLLKDVQFVSEKAFGQLVRREGVAFSPAQVFGTCLFSPGEEPKREKLAWLLSDQTVPANVLDRLTAMAEPFARTNLYVNVATGVRLGLWAHLPAELQEDFLAALAELGRRGVGGERSLGRGAFEVEAAQAAAPPHLNPDGGFFVTLSPYLPTQEEVQAGVLDGAAYELSLRGGWVDNLGRPKKKVRMLQEGSLLRALPGRSGYGGTVDLRPDGFGRPVWRCGRAFPLLVEVGP